MNTTLKTTSIALTMAALWTGCSKGVEVTNPISSTALSSETAITTSSGINTSSGTATAGSSASQDLLNVIDQVPKSSILASSNSTTIPTSSSGIHFSSSTAASSTTQTTSSSTAPVLNGFQVLTTLNTIQLPSPSQNGIDIVQTSLNGTMGILHVDWNGASNWSSTASTLYYAYLTATGFQSAFLLQANGAWTILANGTTALGTPSSSYKEFLASNSQSIFWVDYGVISTTGSRGSTGTSSTHKGRILSQAWTGGAIDTLTDTIPYRARLEASENKLAWVEYDPGATIGRIALMDLTTHAIQYPAPSTHHQDRPSVDGDWLVWEEYLDSTNAVIRAYQISTQQTRNLSSSVGFRTNPNVVGTRVVWEDQRSGTGSIWTYDLTSTQGEMSWISGQGYSTGVRIFGNHLVWIESTASSIGLVTAVW